MNDQDTLYLDKDGLAASGAIELTSRQKEILELIKSNNKISYRTVANTLLEINDSAVQKHLNALKKQGILKRVGGTRWYWKISC